MLQRTPTSPFIIGIAGGTASGKTSVCEKMIADLGQANIHPEKRRVVSIVQDNFYRKLTEAEHREATLGQFNFDHPAAIDFAMMKSVLNDILNSRITRVPKYNFVTHSPEEDDFDTIYPADVVIVEGILIFYDKEIRDVCELKIFVDSDSDTRLMRRVLRDVEDRGRDLLTILKQYEASVKPAFEDFCLPTKKYADLIVPNSSDNRASVAIDLLVQHARERLANRSGMYQNGVQNGVNGHGDVNGLVHRYNGIH